MTTLQKSAISGVVGAGAGGLGGILLAKKKIADEEKRIGRPLTTQEKEAIKKKYIVRGAGAGGLLAGGAALGTQVAANKGNVHAKKMMELADKITKNAGQAKYKAGRLIKKHIGGLQEEEQDSIEAMNKGLMADMRKAQEKMNTTGWNSLTPEEKALAREYNENKSAGAASRINFVKNLGMQHLSPIILGAAGTGITKLLSAGEIQPNELDRKIESLKQQGYSDQQIGQILKQQYGG